MAVTAPRVAGKSVAGSTPSLSLWSVNTMFFGSNAPPLGAVSRKKATCWPGRAANGTRKVSVPWPFTDPAGTIVVPAPSRLLASALVACDPGSIAPLALVNEPKATPWISGGDDRAVRGVVADRDARQVVRRQVDARGRGIGAAVGQEEERRWPPSSAW